MGHRQLLDDVAGDLRRGGGGERQHRHAPEPALEPGQVAVGRPEVVAPLADAVGFVDGDEARTDAGEDVPHPSLDSLGRGVHQLVAAGLQVGLALAPFLERQARVEKGGTHPQLDEGVDLILHERDERRDHQRGSAEQARRDLVGQRLARAGGHDADAVASSQHRRDDRLLAGAETLVAVGLLEHFLGSGQVEGMVGRCRSRAIGGRDSERAGRYHPAVTLERAGDLLQGQDGRARKQGRLRPVQRPESGQGRGHAGPDLVIVARRLRERGTHDRDLQLDGAGLRQG